MIKKEFMEIISNKEIALDTFELVLKNKYVSQAAGPGQFLHISLPGHTLRRPISIASVDPDACTVTTIFKVIGSGTKALSFCKEGEMIDVLGPGGNGFSLENEAGSRILLVGGGIGVPPLYYLGKQLAAQGHKIVSVLGFQNKESVFYEERFKEFGEVHIATDNGSYGTKGFVTDVIGNIGEIDRYYTVGPIPMLRAVTEKLAGTPGYISLEERMGCGIGACYACVIPLKGEEHGYRKICSEGPVFEANEVAL
ncbi:dihydroorotate dehydrogenase electron transfer subunit [Aciduricibacillus chroicocephali]|uniref:Dihydroorotate dehydrogenase B (NAD(+)), electron transfer subunit n=1 Tax=Aciduricibacillus chroicocephali TaxID=3054939 RepID=A0ABY9KXY2_9BACI|nr:dihydroorotate dehydrogenase electron transfer subunit [Bacillaceae bacterium 44XB]